MKNRLVEKIESSQLDMIIMPRSKHHCAFKYHSTIIIIAGIFVYILRVKEAKYILITVCHSEIVVSFLAEF